MTAIDTNDCVKSVKKFSMVRKIFYSSDCKMDEYNPLLVH